MLTILDIDGEFSVRSTTSKAGDLPHCTTRSEVVLRLRLNRNATVRSLSTLHASEAASVQSGYQAVRLLIAYRVRQLCLLREYELICAAIIVGRAQGIQMKVVVNTHMLVLQSQGSPVANDQGNLTSRQRKMMEYASKYHGKASLAPATALQSDRSKAQATKEYVRRYRRAHDYLGCFDS